VCPFCDFFVRASSKATQVEPQSATTHKAQICIPYIGVNEKTKPTEQKAKATRNQIAVAAHQLQYLVWPMKALIVGSQISRVTLY
jgi:hypothetical protein